MALAVPLRPADNAALAAEGMGAKEVEAKWQKK
jgi:hypothetical protein